MIFDTLDHSAHYAGLGDRIRTALKFLQDTDLSALPVGRIDIDGDNLYALVQEYVTKPQEQGMWEAHRRYIDIQYVQRGQERMGFASLERMELGEYVPDKDFLPMSGKGNFVTVFAGAFVIFFPQDGHMPGLCVDAPEPVWKVVLKVKLEA